MNRWAKHLFVTTSIVGLVGWASLILIWLVWTFQPVTLPTIKQPIPVLNPGQEIAVGEPIRLRLDVSKPQDINVESTDRFLVCESGNLVTLTGTARDLPLGNYTIIADSTLLPNKVAVGDECQFLYRVRYYVNPIRDADVEYLSEPFTVR